MYKKALLGLSVAGMVFSFGNNSFAMEDSKHFKQENVLKEEVVTEEISFEKKFEGFKTLNLEQKLSIVQDYLSKEIKQVRSNEKQSWLFLHLGIKSMKSGEIENKLNEFTQLNKILEDTLTPENIKNREQEKVIKQTLEMYKQYHVLLKEQKKILSEMNTISAREQFARYLVMQDYLTKGESEWQLKELNELNRQLGGNEEILKMIKSFEDMSKLNIYYDNRLVIKPLFNNQPFIKFDEMVIFSIKVSKAENGEISFSYKDQMIVQKSDGVYLNDSLIYEGNVVTVEQEENYVDVFKVLTLLGFSVEVNKFIYNVHEPKETESILLKMDNEKIMKLLMAHL
ncbi:hypothetical protein ABD91_25735 [Lysinibacillus sphaericus]|uniref:hypothetical protein n=1 Tax=Lysinibacillus sphaericus TaxID=1421 RepID=UPI0018CC9A8B|nr:hypothetical protein [Lysinibacillus sphaericus]MBG9694142.1 hypothetical protein [Lysinibacillus sphaericus]